MLLTGRYLSCWEKIRRFVNQRWAGSCSLKHVQPVKQTRSHNREYKVVFVVSKIDRNCGHLV